MGWPTWNEVAQLLSAIGFFVSAMVSVRNGQRIEHTNWKIEEVRQATNGMQAAMLKSAGKEGEAKGREDTLAEQAADQSRIVG